MKTRAKLLIPALIPAALLAGCGTTGQTSPADETAPAPETAAMPNAQQSTLQAQLDAYRAGFSERAPQEMQAAFDDGVAEVAESGVLATALKVGDKAPMFALPNATGRDIRLADLLADGPVVITWYRGGWCPYCNLELKAFQDVLPEIKSRSGSLVAISPETPDNSLDTKQKNELDFEVLSDVGNRVASDFGLKYTLPFGVQEQFAGRIDLAKFNGDDKNELPLAVTYVIDRDGTIAWAHVQEDYRVRAEPADVLAALAKLDEQG